MSCILDGQRRDYVNIMQLKEVTRENFIDVINLKVKLRQRDFVGSNEYSLAEAFVKPECVPLAVYLGNTLVGFTMYSRCEPESGQLWIYRIMIGARYQHRGYGRKALQLLIQHIEANVAQQEDFTQPQEIYISVNPENQVAQKLYRSMGFCPTGEMIDGEDVLKRPIGIL